MCEKTDVMCENTCGRCREILESIEQCGHPMVYLNHTNNEYPVKKDTPACGFFSEKIPVQEN